MKSVLFMFLLAGATNAAAQQFHCEGGSGGPGPATAEVEVRYVCGIASVHVQMANAAVPEGLSGNFFSGFLDDSLDGISADGQIGGVDGNIRLTTLDDGTVHLVIYANRDRRIEFGFGTHLICKL